jgi:SNF2 family DNA or RNA helicase
MGLGKTVQAISLLAALHQEDCLGRPHLVVVPLSTARNWEREFAAWAPYLNVVCLTGNAAARKVRCQARK